MTNSIKIATFSLISFFFITSCGKNGCTDPLATNYDAEATKNDGSCTTKADTNTTIKYIKFVFKFDSTQERLGNFGEGQSIPIGNSAQHPRFNLMGAHYIEFSKENDIPAYNGETIYDSPITTAGGTNAIVFDSAAYGGDNEQFFQIPISEVTAATYKYIRVSLSYQNYTIDFTGNGLDLTGTIASFVGANTYIENYTIKNESVTVNGNKLQGYWGFETDYPGVPLSVGQAPGTTVPNPIAATSAIPLGSCLVTGIFESPLVITGNETEDITIICSISTNNSFEWSDYNGNGKYEPLDGDTVVDMGVRGLIPVVQ